MDKWKKLINHAIENLDSNHGQQIKAFYQSIGVKNADSFGFCNHKADSDTRRFYHINSDGWMGNRSESYCEANGIKIVTLDEAKAIVWGKTPKFNIGDEVIVCTAEEDINDWGVLCSLKRVERVYGYAKSVFKIIDIVIFDGRFYYNGLNDHICEDCLTLVCKAVKEKVVGKKIEEKVLENQIFSIPLENVTLVSKPLKKQIFSS